MVITDIPERLKRIEIPGRVTLLEGNGDMPKIEVTTDWGSAEVYLHGAHVTDFRLKGQPPLLFTSQCSRFEDGQPIRGGIPVIFPWFGAREGEPMHGCARLVDWELHEAITVPDGGVSLRFNLIDRSLCATFPPYHANYVVTVTDQLALELILTNTSADQSFTFENCLHTYFAVGDANAISISGLQGVDYLDKVENFVWKTETADAVKIAAEVDRIYFNTTGAVEIHDPKLGRKVRIEKSGSASTVVWNPWINRSQQMPDFGNDEYKQMVCVESGNVGPNKLSLQPGRSSVLKVVLSSAAL
ncbi:MAG: D-hexose-6-phosphate mutarotase [Verrucomicrobia bacterium]|nr:D-hexose-6-phosphate mutarotase [Verrucomicrobiota bacterium]